MKVFIYFSYKVATYNKNYFKFLLDREIIRRSSSIQTSCIYDDVIDLKPVNYFRLVMS